MRRSSSSQPAIAGLVIVAFVAIVTTGLAASRLAAAADRSDPPSLARVLAPQQPTATPTLVVGDCTTDEPYLATAEREDHQHAGG